MASADILNQIKANKEKITELNKIHESMNNAIEAVKKEQRKYVYVSNQWAGEKERNLSKEFGSDGTGMHAVRDQIAKDGTTVLNNISDMIKNIESSNVTLQNQYIITKGVEDALAAEEERKKIEQNKTK